MREDFSVYVNYYQSQFRNAFVSVIADEQERHNLFMSVSAIGNPTERDVKLRSYASRVRSPIARQEITESRRFAIIADNLQLWMDEEVSDPVRLIAKCRHELKAYFDACEIGSYQPGIVDTSTRDIEWCIYLIARNGEMSISDGKKTPVLPDLSIYDYYDPSDVNQARTVLRSKDPEAEKNAIAYERAVAENGNTFPIVNRQAAVTKSNVESVVSVVDTKTLPAMETMSSTKESVAGSAVKARPSVGRRPYERAD